MKTTEEIIRNEGYWIGKIQMELFSQLESYMKENNLKKVDLAKKLGVSKGYITQILNADFDHKLSKLVELSLIMDKVPVFTLKSVDKYINQMSTKTFSLETNQLNVESAKEDSKDYFLQIA